MYSSNVTSALCLSSLAATKLAVLTNSAAYASSVWLSSASFGGEIEREARDGFRAGRVGWVSVHVGNHNHVGVNVSVERKLVH